MHIFKRKNENNLHWERKLFSLLSLNLLLRIAEIWYHKSIMGTFLLMLACKVNIFYRSIFTCNIKYFSASSQLIAFRGPTATVIDFGHLKS